MRRQGPVAEEAARRQQQEAQRQQDMGQEQLRPHLSTW